MKFSVEAEKRGRKSLRQYNLTFVFIILVLLGVALPMSRIESKYVFLLVFSLLIVVEVIVLRLVNRMLLIGLILDRLDPEAYLAAIYHGRLNRPHAFPQLFGEYFRGNYGDVLRLCKMKLSEKRVSPKYACFYLSYLANVYFEIGDDEQLRAVLQRYKRFLSGMNRQKRRRILKKTGRMGFYAAYLEGELDACREYLNRKGRFTEETKWHRTFFAARVALLQGETDAARAALGRIAEVAPRLGYGILSTKILERLDEGKAGREATYFPELIEHADETESVEQYPGVSRRLRGVILGGLIALLIVGIAFIVSGLVGKENARREYEREVAAYRESIRVLLEGNYDGVEILEIFNVMDGDRIVDSMVLARTGTDVVVGALYCYEGAEETYYKELAVVPAETIAGETPWSVRLGMDAVTSDYEMVAYFSVDAEAPKNDISHQTTFTLNGYTVHFVIYGLEEK